MFVCNNKRNINDKSKKLFVCLARVRRKGIKKV